MEKKNVGKILIALGLITLITTLVDYYALLFPLQVKNPQWAFSVTQSISDICIMPALAVIFIIVGGYLVKDKFNEKLFNYIEKSTGIVSLLFAIAFAGSAVLYGISVGGVEGQMVEQIKTAATSTKDQLTQFYEANKTKVDEKKYSEYIEKMDQQMMIKINQASAGIQKTTFKTIVNLAAFSFLYLYIFLKVFGLIDFFKTKVLKMKKKQVNV